jgi:hypothetical protein
VLEIIGQNFTLHFATPSIAAYAVTTCKELRSAMRVSVITGGRPSSPSHPEEINVPAGNYGPLRNAKRLIHHEQFILRT